MRSRNLRYVGRKLRIGLRGRCPECERGALFDGYFQPADTCPYCHVRFSRKSGDSIGAVYLNVALAEVSAMAGFFIVHALTDIPIIHQLIFWVPYLIVFSVVFYPYARGLWTSILYLTGAIYADPDYEREYVAARHRQNNAHLSYDPETE